MGNATDGVGVVIVKAIGFVGKGHIDASMLSWELNHGTQQRAQRKENLHR